MASHSMINPPIHMHVCVNKRSLNNVFPHMHTLRLPFCYVQKNVFAFCQNIHVLLSLLFTKNNFDCIVFDATVTKYKNSSIQATIMA